MKNKTISIVVTVDIVGTLSSDSLEGNMYLLDNNKKGGSLNEGTAELKTRVEVGDTILWNILPIEPEAYAGLTDIIIDESYCEISKQVYQESDILFFSGKIKKIPTQLPYKLKMKIGTREQVFESKSTCFLIGNSSVTI